MGYIHHQPLSESEEGPFHFSDECVVKTYFEDVNSSPQSGSVSFPLFQPGNHGFRMQLNLKQTAKLMKKIVADLGASPQGT